ncbi:MAG: hypothetical protein ACTSV2_17740 [Candidatus Thorarchaeota archaeon]
MKTENRDGSSRVPSLLFYLSMLSFMVVAYWIQPLLTLLPATSIAAYCCFRSIDKQTSQRRHILDDALQRLEVQEEMAKTYTEETEEEPMTQNLEFPSFCPDCEHSLHVKNVTWINSQTIICKNCGSTIKAFTVSE